MTGHCPAGTYCDGNFCLARKLVGQLCVASVECISGLCENVCQPLAQCAFPWGEILDLSPGRPPFADLPMGRQSAIIYFAVIDFVAAVGLWLTSAWGGVVWLLAATCCGLGGAWWRRTRPSRRPACWLPIPGR